MLLYDLRLCGGYTGIFKMSTSASVDMKLKSNQEVEYLTVNITNSDVIMNGSR